jgi:hypothetical protein
VGFTFEPIALANPTAIVGPILEIDDASLDVEGASYEESNDA